MIRLIFRVLSVISLAIAVIMTVTDATRSIAISHLEPTPLGAYWLQYAPDSLDATHVWMEANGAWLWDPVLLALLKLPGFAVFAALALLLYAIGHRRPQSAGRMMV